MAYSYPPVDLVNFSWSTETVYSHPVSVDFSWGNYGCNYIANVPASPNVIFFLDSPDVPYVAPSGSITDFYLVCDVNLSETIYVSGEATLTPWYFEGEISYFGYIDISGNSTFPPIISDGVINLAVMVIGDCEFDLIVSDCGDIDRGNTVRSNLRIRDEIQSLGFLEMTPIVYDAEIEFENNEIVSNGLALACVIELKQQMEFSDGISHLRGRVEFGFPNPNIIREVYEISNNRSLAIPVFPEDPQFPVFLNNTNLNLSDEEIRRGTIDMSFTFEHDVKDIKRISVWVMGPDGHAYRDKMRIVDFPLGNYEDHIIFNPFQNTVELRVPIHCVSKKQNQFYIEVEYRNASTDLADKRPRTIGEEKYIIPFQAHFDNRNPYVNIADHVSFDGVGFNELKQNIQTEFIENGRTYVFPETMYSSDPESNDIPSVTFFSDELVKTYLFVEFTTVLNPTANDNTYFMQEYVDLMATQIGG